MQCTAGVILIISIFIIIIKLVHKYRKQTKSTVEAIRAYYRWFLLTFYHYCAVIKHFRTIFLAVLQ